MTERHDDKHERLVAAAWDVLQAPRGSMDFEDGLHRLRKAYDEYRASPSSVASAVDANERATLLDLAKRLRSGDLGPKAVAQQIELVLFTPSATRTQDGMERKWRWGVSRFGAGVWVTELLTEIEVKTQYPADRIFGRIIETETLVPTDREGA